MKAAEATWPEIADFSKEAVVVIPTGAFEQHGPHLPLITDTLIVTAVAEAVESKASGITVILPTIWLGASAHHLSFAGTLSGTAATYMQVIREIIGNYQRHGFRKFLVLNGHGGNVEPNRMALREAKAAIPNHVFAHFSYFDLIGETLSQNLKGPLKGMRHACEAETSLVMHLRPDLVIKDRIRDDGMKPEEPIQGLIQNFDEMSDQGSIGFATYATAETGRILFDAAVLACKNEIDKLSRGFVMLPMEE